MLDDEMHAASAAGRRHGWQHRLLAWVWAILAGSLLLGCAGRPTASTILMRGPRSASAPSFGVWMDLDHTPPEDAPGLIARYLDIVEGDNGYARLAAMRGVLHFVSRSDRRGFISQRLVDDVAQYAVRVARPGQDVALSVVMGKTDLSMFDPDYDWFNRPIDAAFEMAVDGVHVTIPWGERDPWGFGSAKAWLDGSLILDEPVKGANAALSRDAVRYTVKMSEVLGGTRARLLGKHVMCAEIEVVAPNGTKSTAKLERKFKVWDDQPAKGGQT